MPKMHQNTFGSRALPKVRRTMGKGFVEKMSLEPGVEVRKSNGW